MKPRPHAPASLAAGLVLVAACNGGNGTSGLAPGATDHALTYDTGSFAWVDPHAPDFHPLTEEVFRATARDELILLLADAPGKPALGAWFRDDALAGGDFGPCDPDWLARGFTPTDRAVGDVDGDGRPEPVFVGIEEGSALRKAGLRLGRAGVHGSGTGLDALECLTIEPDPFPGDLTDVDVALADHDGDGDLELLLARSWAEHHAVRLSVVDLVERPGGPVLAELASVDLPAQGASLAAMQADDDPAEEVLLTTRREGALERTTVRLLDDWAGGYKELAVLWTGPTWREAPEPLVAQLDADPQHEVVLVDDAWRQGPLHVRRLTALDWTGTEALVTAEVQVADALAWNDVLGDGLLAVDRNEDGLDEVLWVGNRLAEPASATLTQAHALPTDGGCFASPCEVIVQLRSWTPGEPGTIDLDLDAEATYAGAPLSYDLVARDEDGSGSPRVLVSWKVGPLDELPIVSIDAAGDVDPIGSLAAGPEARPLLAAGDYDDDGLRLRYVGKRLELPAPIPMALVAAPPSAAGTMQNLAWTRSHQVATDGGAVLELRPEVTVSLGLGREVHDLFGVLEVDECATLGDACAASLADDQPVAAHAELTGTWDRDVVVFAAVLQRVYEYEVLAAPNAHAVGELLTVNVPVAARADRWDLPVYLEAMDPADHPPADALAHVIGDPASYPTRDAVVATLEVGGGPWTGWTTDGSQVFQGHGHASDALELAAVLAEDLVTDHGACGHLKAGGPACGLTVGVDAPVVYELRLRDAARLSAEVGSLPGWDWLAWRYDWGLAVYRRTTDHGQPLVVQTYWTEPLGLDYP